MSVHRTMYLSFAVIFRTGEFELLLQLNNYCFLKIMLEIGRSKLDSLHIGEYRKICLQGTF